MPTSQNGISSVQGITMVTEMLPAMENIENIQFVATDNEVSEEVVSHGDEINIAVNSLEASGTVNLSEGGVTITENVQYSGKLGEDTVNVQERQHLESGENYASSKNEDIQDSGTSSDDNIK